MSGPRATIARSRNRFVGRPESSRLPPTLAGQCVARAPVMATVSKLSPERSRELLARNHVARIAVSVHDLLDISPVHYVFHEDSFYVRISRGAKLQVLRRHPYVALEVDEIDSLFEWRSVVAKGFVELLDATVDSQRHASALERLRALVPEALDAGDPAPSRTVLLRIHASEIQGRQSKEPSGAKAPGEPLASRSHALAGK